ncbi:hypothetical protein [Maritimibacter sp. 55A14]|uniref:hypothetical protein n=1 Tax=Maritimibacter sp. 55A14 TaxID=2174844 RepID=UPI001304F03C|nr:hypothetical protein [Maritimibacter sp. 55A14]
MIRIPQRIGAAGEGTVPWRAVFRALADCPADPHLVLELNDSSGIPGSVTWPEPRGLAC